MFSLLIEEKTKGGNTHANLQQTSRDKIPQIIENNGKTYTTKTLFENRYTNEICKKTQEELTEYEATTLEDINTIRKKKAEERDGFQNRTLLMVLAIFLKCFELVKENIERKIATNISDNKYRYLV